MRAMVAIGCWILAVGLSIALVPAAWVDLQVSDRASFIDFAGPLGDDEEFVEALSAALAETAVRDLDLPDGLAERVEPLIEEGVVRFASQDGFTDAWSDSLDRTHATMFPADGSGRAALDVTPMAELVLPDVLPDQLRVLELDDAALIIPVGDDEADRWIERMDHSSAAVWICGAVVAGSVVVLLLASRNRWAALAWVGVGAIVSAGAQAVLLGVAGPGAIRGFESGRPAANEMMAVVSQAAGDSMAGWLWILAGAGAAIAVVAAIAGAVVRSGSR